MTSYITYHPGGSQILLKFAGQDGTVGFNKFHGYLNIDRILGV